MSVVIVGGNECMIRCALSEVKGQGTRIARSHTSSMAALKTILEENVV